MSTYITVAIPYVNAVPHLGYAYELIEADLAARARRALGEPVRFLGGTDDFSLKNVLAAHAVGESTPDFVNRHAERFAALAEPLAISFDDFIRTSTDPRHRPGVERLWRACAGNGDLYRRDYRGCYCVGCEQFYEPSELEDGLCPEHRTPVDVVAETNWFFRLSRYTERLEALIDTGTLLVDPPRFRREVLAFIRAGLRDISVSRSVERARGWGIPVPDDASQVIYVWFDALANYISALDYGHGGRPYDDWWRNVDERVHVVGKGIVRFHAVYWPAFLLSAGEPLPTHIRVHPYLTVAGAKLSKSSGGGFAPTRLTSEFGADALRWWIARGPSATDDTDFTVDRLITSANEDLANGLGNAVSRIASLARRYRDGTIPRTGAEALRGSNELPTRVAEALARFDRRAATDLIRDAIGHVNRDIEATAPWAIARDPGAGARFDELLDVYATTLRHIADAIRPITPDLADRATALFDQQRASASPPVFPRLDRPAGAALTGVATGQA